MYVLEDYNFLTVVICLMTWCIKGGPSNMPNYSFYFLLLFFGFDNTFNCQKYESKFDVLGFERYSSNFFLERGIRTYRSKGFLSKICL